MRANRGKDEQFPTDKHRIEQRDVVQVRAAPVGIVEQYHITRLDTFIAILARKILHCAKHRPGHGHDVPGVVIGLGHHVGLWIE